MSEEAACDWLDAVKTQAQRVQAAVGLTAILVPVVLITLAHQITQRSEDQSSVNGYACAVDYSSINPSDPRTTPSPCATEIKTLEAAYGLLSTLPHDPTWQPWYDFTSDADILAEQMDFKALNPQEFARLQDTGDDKKYKKFWSAMAQLESQEKIQPGISSSTHSLCQPFHNFESDLRLVKMSSNAKIQFLDLSWDKLFALSFVYTFRLDNQPNSDFNRELEKAKIFATPEFIAKLKQIDSPVAKKLFDDRFLKALSAGQSLKDFDSLRIPLTAKDPAQFANEADLSAAEESFRNYRLKGSDTLRAIRLEDARLEEEIQNISQDMGQMPLPLLNITISLSTFGYLSGILEILLCLWIFWQTRLMAFAIDRYRSLANPYEPSRVGAALLGMPSAGRLGHLVNLLIAACLSSPSILGSAIMWARRSHQPLPAYLHRSAYNHLSKDIYLLIPIVVLGVSITLVRFTQNIKSRTLTA